MRVWSESVVIVVGHSSARIVTMARSLSLPEEAEPLTDSEALQDDAMTIIGCYPLTTGTRQCSQLKSQLRRVLLIQPT